MNYSITEYLAEPFDQADFLKHKQQQKVAAILNPVDDGIMHIETIRRLEAIVRFNEDSD